MRTPVWKAGWPSGARSSILPSSAMKRSLHLYEWTGIVHRRFMHEEQIREERGCSRVLGVSGCAHVVVAHKVSSSTLEGPTKSASVC